MRLFAQMFSSLSQNLLDNLRLLSAMFPYLEVTRFQKRISFDPPEDYVSELNAGHCVSSAISSAWELSGVCMRMKHLN